MEPDESEPDIGMIEPEWDDAAEMAADEARYNSRYE